MQEANTMPMPEGPPILLLREAISGFKGKKVIAVTGDTKIEKQKLLGQQVVDIKSWGKHLLLCFPDFTVRIHLMMFVTYRINEAHGHKPRLGLRFKTGELNFYSCSVAIVNEPLDELYDWSSDVLSDQWNSRKAIKKLSEQPDLMVCDVLMDQQLFSGVGNIIKNEVLFRIRVHLKSRIGAMPSKKIRELVREARTYSFEFLEWKRNFELRKHWLVYNKKICPRCNIPVLKQNLGKAHRRSFYCENCQVLYDE